MSRKIVGVTVGTPIGISAIKEKLNPVTSVNGVEADENGNVEITIPDPGGNVDLTGYATEQFVRDGYQPKGNYLTEHQDISGKLDASELPSAINTALAQAKASGEFDGKDGTDGKDGQDGYTPQKGIDYFDGQPGKDGVDGKDGSPGTDGITPHVGSNGNWFIGDNDTGIPATGPAGGQGLPGTPGADGKDGKDGKDGADGKSAYQYAEDGGYTGTEEEFAIGIANTKAMPYVSAELVKNDSINVFDNTKATTEAANNSEYFTDDYIVVEKDTYKLDKAAMLSIPNKHLTGNGSVAWKDWDTQPQNWKDTEDASMLSSKLKARYADDPVYLSMKLPGEANFVSDTLVRPAMRASNGSGTFTQINNIGAIMPVDYTKLPDDVVICIGNLSVYTLSRKENARWKLHDKVAIPAGQAMYYLPWATSGDASVQINASKVTVYDDYVRFALKKNDFAPDSNVADSLAKCLHFWGNHKNLDLADNLAVITFFEVWTETADAVGNLYTASGCDQKSADKKTISQNFWGRNVLLQTEKTVIIGHNISDALYDELRDTPNDPRNVYADYTESFSASYDAEQAVINHNADDTAHPDIREEIADKIGDMLSRVNQVTEVVQPMEVLTPSININPGVWVHEHLKDDGSIGAEDWGNPTQWIVSADYIPVTGGRTITLYYDKAEWNSNNNGVAFDMVQYDANKDKISATKDVFRSYINNESSFTLDANTAFIRIGYTNWTDNKIDTPLEDIKVAVYYIEDVRLEFLEYGFGSESVYGVPGEKVFFTSPNGKKHTLTVDDNGNVNGDGGSGGGGVSTWEDLGSTFEQGIILAETSPMFVEDQAMFVLMDAVKRLTTGQEYTVDWNGTEYSCICEDYIEEDTHVGWMLGNTSVLGGAQENEAPFVIVIPFKAIDGMTGMIVPLDGSAELTVSIAGEVEIINPLPSKYLPELRAQKKIIIDADNLTASIPFDTAWEMDIAELQATSTILYNSIESAAIAVRRQEAYQSGIEVKRLRISFANIELKDRPLEILTIDWQAINGETEINFTDAGNRYSIPENLSDANRVWLSQPTTGATSNWTDPCFMEFRWIWLRSGTGKRFKVAVDDNGNLTATEN